ncbi:MULTISPECIES: 16S rRNA (guanine(1207)-N(2))-methyltransferase RsmC [unclassified Agarivorans]|uniref:16S rRNA (guanine(1207)-N(2))-methyltransferase RsmC n=1 Tax=unclassified Agarivorans TaxID=2636026 RepID=UPI0026E2959B|nr:MULTISPECIES: 16S rRNA (guanine(1207)-N(2))-methyltransferase RsmC [unclassified Agarivorans]MDO6684522.1 16S rRNA (guanine(1207)-N(2))-methyltransferase RsmC [Agarivorans sp. 3_MG-2023]MDO6714687.1 16S rRNA (guanine(1207)-N(2))-methyltransferase RsmC [Agarivorans sp. 2_MG-2023]
MNTSLHATSQVLARHDQLFAERHLVVAGQLADNYPLNLLEQVASLQICCSHYGHFTHFKKTDDDKLSCQFSVEPRLAKNSNALLFFMPKAKQEAAYLFASILPQLSDDADIFVVGENRGGVKSCEKLLAEFGIKMNKIDSARRCGLYFGSLTKAAPAFQPEQWLSQFEVALPNTRLQVMSLPGVFNHGKLDDGSQLLLDNLPALHGSVLDFGCGAGIIGASQALLHKVDITLLDVSAYAVTSTKATLKQNQLNGTVIASDGLSEVNQRFDFIVSNPPFHAGIDTQYETTETFLAQAKQHLNAQGELWLVANSFLQYEALIKQHFARYESILDNKKFKILRCCV